MIDIHEVTVSKEEIDQIYDAYANYISREMPDELAVPKEGCEEKILGIAKNDIQFTDVETGEPIGLSMGTFECGLHIGSMKFVYLLDGKFVFAEQIKTVDTMINALNSRSFEDYYDIFMKCFLGMLQNVNRKKEKKNVSI